MGVTQNIYTTHNPDSLARAKVDMEGALKQRRDAFAAELARQRANDALCKDFASLAEPFSKSISERKDAITKSSAELEEQLKTVNGHLANVAKDGGPLAKINEVSARMDAAGITNNRHTTLTAKDVEVQWAQYQAFLERKKKMLIEEIENVKMRGITAEQFKEIADAFAQFDVNKSGTIDRKELRACLYSLGEEKTAGEVDAIMKKFGGPTGIPHDGFKEFMIGIIGVSSSKDDILNSFKLINRGENAVADRMELVMTEPDMKYFSSTAKSTSSGVWDYKGWTESVFAR